LRALERFVRPLQILLRAFPLAVGALKILVGSLAFPLGALQLLLRALMIALRPLEILLRSFAVGLGALKFLLCPFTLAVRTLEIVVGRLPIRLGAFTIGVGAFEVGLGALQIRLRPLALGVRAFEIRLHARPFSRDGLFQFAPRLCGGCRCRLFRLASCSRDGLRQRAFHLSARGGHFRFQARSPLRVECVQLRCPPLFGVGFDALPRFLERLLVALGETPEMRVELSLKLGANGVNHATDWFLGH